MFCPLYLQKVYKKKESVIPQDACVQNNGRTCVRWLHSTEIILFYHAARFVSVPLPNSTHIQPIWLPSYKPKFLLKEEHVPDRRCAVRATTQKNPELVCSVHTSITWQIQDSWACSTEILCYFTAKSERHQVFGIMQKANLGGILLNTLYLALSHCKLMFITEVAPWKQAVS